LMALLLTRAAGPAMSGNHTANPGKA